MSMHSALTKLGYKTYHFMEVGQRELPNESHIEPWREAFRAKMYGNGKPFGTDEFAKLLRNYSAVTDAPCVCFSDELIAAFPNAKVILSTRDPDKWLASMENAYLKILASPDWKWFRALCELDIDLLAPYIDLLKMPLQMWTGGDWENRAKMKKAFMEHYVHIREVVPKQNMIEWVPQDGYEPICKLLGKAVPDEPFPNINKGDAAAQFHKPIAYVRLAILLASYLKWPALALVWALCVWLFTRFRIFS